jgi:integrase
VGVLTDTAIRKAKAQDKPYKLSDTNGLHVYVTKAGSKIFRYRYEFLGKEKTLVIGDYPEMSLLEARRARDEARLLLKSGRDPSAQKKLEKVIQRSDAEATFSVLAKEWFDLASTVWAPAHANEVWRTLKRDVLPHIGGLPVTAIDAPTVLGVLRLIEKRGAVETAKRHRQRISAIFVYAISTGRATTDPAAVVQSALVPLHKGRRPALTTVEAIRQLLADVCKTPGRPHVKLALKLLAITAVRPGTLADTPWSEWADLDENNPVWRIPAARMKLKLERKQDDLYDHLVPLPPQALEIIALLRRLTGRGEYVFPNPRRPTQPMSANAMGYFLNRADYYEKHVPHGFRASFSSIMNERYPQDRHVIDLMLAHIPKDKVEAAYNRALHIERRKELAQIYADLILDGVPSLEEFVNGPVRINKKGPNPARSRRKRIAA